METPAVVLHWHSDAEGNRNWHRGLKEKLSLQVPRVYCSGGSGEVLVIPTFFTPLPGSPAWTRFAALKLTDVIANSPSV